MPQVPAPVKLSAYAVVLLAVFAASLAVGAAVAPVAQPDRPQQAPYVPDHER